jgi:hypothetical protein
MINEFAPKAVQTKLHRLEALLTEAKLLSNEIESDVVAIAAERGVDHAIAVHAYTPLHTVQAEIGASQQSVADAHRALARVGKLVGVKVTASGTWTGDELTTGHHEDVAAA